MTEKRTPTALFILDGWGYREESDNNALLHANTPFWDQIWKDAPHSLIHTSGEAVGLPEGQMGNSEVGHMNLGAGRVLYQSLTRINKDIRESRFASNPGIAKAINQAKNGHALHIFGLLSPGGVHSHEDQIFALCRAASEQGAQRVYLHAFLDGRDTPPRSAEPSLKKADSLLRELGCGRVASIVGRYYAMDRDNRWERVAPAYQLLTEGKAEFCAPDPVSGLKAAYGRDENDEFVQATAIVADDESAIRIEDGDAVVFMNFRPDRAREMSRAFVEDEFDGFRREVRPNLGVFVTLTEYASDLPAECAYPPEKVVNGLGEYMAELEKTQLRIAETEKYAHVTFFFSGGREETYPGEDRVLVPSPDVATYDLQPEMSAPEVTEKLVEAITSGKYDLIVCNYANGDMVGHTGKQEAVIKAVECLDECLRKIHAALQQVGGQCLITADHGNAELMVDENGQPHTQHTTGPVPLVYLGPQKISLSDGGRLSDVAPSLLDLMQLEQPSEMTGRSLIVR